MRVDGPGATEASAKTKKKKGVGGSDGAFDALLSAASEEEETTQPAGVTSLPQMGALLALQELTGRGEGNAKAFQRGEDILAELNDLRMGLLTGLIPPSKLKNLAALVKESLNETIDPALQDILRDIELRALVEIEKFNKTKTG